MACTCLSALRPQNRGSTGPMASEWSRSHLLSLNLEAEPLNTSWVKHIIELKIPLVALLQRGGRLRGRLSPAGSWPRRCSPRPLALPPAAQPPAPPQTPTPCRTPAARRRYGYQPQTTTGAMGISVGTDRKGGHTNRPPRYAGAMMRPAQAAYPVAAPPCYPRRQNPGMSKASTV